MTTRQFIKRSTAWVGILSAFAIAISAAAEAQSPSHPPIPEEAYTACASKTSGDACTVTFHEHTIEGTCATHPNESRLHCRPSAPPPGPPPSNEPRASALTDGR